MKVHYHKKLNSDENQCELDKSNITISFIWAHFQVVFTIFLYCTLSVYHYLYILVMVCFYLRIS